MTNSRTVHDSDAELDYSQDWSTWLSTDTIATATATVTLGTATIDRVTHDDTSVTFWVSGATAGLLDVNVRITTAAGRQDDRSTRLVVEER